MEKVKEKSVGVFVLLALLLSIGVGAAMEQESPDWSDPAVVDALIEQLATAGDNADELWAELSPEAQAAVLKYLKVERVVAKVTPGDITLLKERGCKEFEVEVYGYNIFGNKLWCYFQKIEWCYDGSEITSKTRLRWGEVHFPFWQFAGHIGNSEQGGVGEWSYRAWTQGEFKLCLGGDIGCIQYYYPWIDMTVYGNGGYDYDCSGNEEYDSNSVFQEWVEQVYSDPNLTPTIADSKLREETFT